MKLLDNNEDAKQKSGSKKRPSTSKGLKNTNFKEVEDLKKNLTGVENKQNIRKNKKYLTKIMEYDLIHHQEEEEEEQEQEQEESNRLNTFNRLGDHQHKFSEDEFFKSLHKENKEHIIKNVEEKKAENLKNKRLMKEIVSSIIDISEVYYDFQNTKNEELIDVKIWNELAEKFIYNKQIIKRKKKKKVLSEEEIGNYNFDINVPIDEKYSQNFGIYEISEMKNYLNQIGNKYDKNKNNLFFKK